MAAKRGTTREHIIPESLGNKTFILGRGCVCDECNNFFSQVDEYFCHYHMGAALRPFFVSKTKRGKGPVAYLEGPGAEIRRGPGGRMAWRQSIEPFLSEDPLRITVASDGIRIVQKLFLPDVNTGRISRFLAKVGIETLHFKRGADVFADRFDRLREYARYNVAGSFVPYWWGENRQHAHLDLRLVELSARKGVLATFLFLWVHGYLYIQPLDELDKYSGEGPSTHLRIDAPWLKFVGKDVASRREPTEFVFQSSTDSEPT